MTTGSAKNPPSALLVVLALLIVQVCFGANYVISKVVLSHFPPLVWGGIRIAIAASVMLTVCILSKRKRPELNRAFLWPLAGFALLGTILNQISFLVGLNLTTSANSAVLNTLIPVFTLLIVTVRGQEALTFRRGFGFVLALFGVLSIRSLEGVRFTDATFIGDLLNVLNCVLYAFFLSYSKPFMEKHDTLWVAAFLFLYGTVGINLIGIPSWIEFTPPEMTGVLWVTAGVAVLFGTLIPYFLNFWALKFAKASQVALFIYVQPIVAAAVAFIWLGEVMSLRAVVASVLIFSGLLVALTGQVKRKTV